MRLYIWEGGRISTGYHDNGTLVVLAESVEQAREVAIQSAKDWAAMRDEEQYDGGDNRWHWADGVFGGRVGIYWPGHQPGQDDTDDDAVNQSIQREPDRVVELGTPTLVAFNGGGYD